MGAVVTVTYQWWPVEDLALGKDKSCSSSTQTYRSVDVNLVLSTVVGSDGNPPPPSEPSNGIHKNGTQKNSVRLSKRALDNTLPGPSSSKEKYELRLKTPADPHSWQVATPDGPATKFLTALGVRLAEPPAVVHQPIGVKLLLPTQNGVIGRADHFERRLVDSDVVSHVVTFAHPNQAFKAYVPPLLRSNTTTDFFGVLAAAVCAIVVKPSVVPPIDPALPDEQVQQARTELTQHVADFAAQRLHLLEEELKRRLAPPWQLPLEVYVPRQRTLALVEGRASRTYGEILFRAARALDIGLVVLERQGHWLQQPEHADIYGALAAFVPIDMTVDAGLAGRIADALQNCGHQVEAITTVHEEYLIPSAVASEKLGLPTIPADTIRRTVDKYETRMMDNTVNLSLRFGSLEDLKEQLQTAYGGVDDTSIGHLFPLVLKPCMGRGSEGVFRINSASQLFSAISQYWSPEKGAARHGIDMMVESYVEGPEVDANFVLYDGEILFFEMVDDFPCTADAADAGLAANFQELTMVYPSVLPANEIALARKEIHKTLLRLGLHTGVYHTEARIRNSRMDYFSTTDDLGAPGSILDLEPVEADEGRPEPSVFLLEINARPVGMQGVTTTGNVYGVDYYAMVFLCALRDRVRTELLARPFTGSDPLWSVGAQYHCEMVLIPVPKGGIFDGPDDVCEDLRQRCPELMESVVLEWSHFKKGDRVPEPADKRDLPWIATLIVHSKTSRRQALRFAREIRENIRYTII